MNSADDFSNIKLTTVGRKGNEDKGTIKHFRPLKHHQGDYFIPTNWLSLKVKNHGQSSWNKEH